MKICITSPIFPPDLGGPSTYVPSFASYLVQRGHQVTVVAFCSDPAPQGWPFKVVSIPRCWMPLRYLRDFWAVWREVRHADLLYINEHLALHVALAGRLRGKPMVIRVCVDGTWEISHRLGWHDDTITEYQRHRYGAKVVFARKLQRLWWGWMRRIIAPSRFLKDIVEGYGVPAARTELIYNAYHGPLEFAPDKAACRSQLGVPAGRVLLLTVCRLMIWKGVDGLIRALGTLPSTHHLYVAGDGEELERWTALARELGLADRVHFVGNVPHAQLMSWIRAADVFLLNSSYEGLSHTLLEVMWLGTPAAVSAVCGNPELIEDRVNGRCFRFQDVASIATCVRELLADPDLARRYVERSREKVRSFAREPLFARKEQLFLSILGRETHDAPDHAAMANGEAHPGSPGEVRGGSQRMAPASAPHAARGAGH